MGEKEIQEVAKQVNDLVHEIGDIMSNLKAKLDSLEQADIELYKSVDELDAELGFWDTLPKKKSVNTTGQTDKTQP